MRPNTRAPAFRSRIVALLFGLAFAVALWIFAVGSVRDAKIRQGASSYLVATLATSGADTPAPAPDGGAITRALLLHPLDPVLVNAGVYRDTALSPSHTLPSAKLTALDRLGWRYTPAVQNRIYATALSGDLNRTEELAEALLRRQTIVDQATAVMNLIETDPGARPLLVTKLAGNPRWRADYLQAIEPLRTPAQVRARGELALDLQRAGSPLRRDELGPITSSLVAANMTELAYRVWRANTRAPAIPLNDPGFRRLYAQRGTDVTTMPFEWILRSDDGAWTEVRQDGRPLVDLHWDGRGAPVFLQQQTFLTPGPYRLRIDGPAIRPDLLKEVSFEAHCGGALPVRFNRLVRTGGGTLLLATDRPIACTDPIIFVQGIAPENRPFGLAKLAQSDEGITVTLAGLSLHPDR